MPNKPTSGINKFAKLIQDRSQEINKQPPVLDFGEIMSDWSLKTTMFGINIPKNDYLVCRSLTIGKKDEVLTKTKKGQGKHPHGSSGGHPQIEGDGVHSHPSSEGEHIHDVLIPEKLRELKIGDRVLVAWVSNDPVVIDIINEKVAEN